MELDREGRPPSGGLEKRTPRSCEERGVQGYDTRLQPKRSATPRKWQRVLRYLADGGTLNRWDAARELRDSCLNTTVSQIEARGVEILREDETVAGAFGPVHCCRYWLAPQSRQRARELLGLPLDTAEPSARSATSEAAQ